MSGSIDFIRQETVAGHLCHRRQSRPRRRAAADDRHRRQLATVRARQSQPVDRLYEQCRARRASPRCRRSTPTSRPPFPIASSATPSGPADRGRCAAGVVRPGPAAGAAHRRDLVPQLRQAGDASGGADDDTSRHGSRSGGAGGSMPSSITNGPCAATAWPAPACRWSTCSTAARSAMAAASRATASSSAAASSRAGSG